MTGVSFDLFYGKVEQEVPGSIPGPATYNNTFVSPYVDSRRAVVSCWPNFVHLALVNRLGCLGLPRNSVVRVNDHPDMAIAVYRGRKATKH